MASSIKRQISGPTADYIFTSIFVCKNSKDLTFLDTFYACAQVCLAEPAEYAQFAGRECNHRVINICQAVTPQQNMALKRLFKKL